MQAQAENPCPVSQQVRIVQDVFTVLMGVDMQPQEARPATRKRAGISAAIYFSKAWSGAMVLECDAPFALGVAARMLDCEGGAAIDDDDVKDVIGELANMIGGNLKALLPPSTQLSIPWVSTAGKDNGVPLHGRRLTQILFEGECGRFCMNLFQAQ